MSVSDNFKNEINYIKNEDLRKIVAATLDASPECIVEIPASSTGKFHPDYSLGNGGLMRHIKGAVGIAHCMIESEIFENIVMGFNAQEDMDYFNKIAMYADATYAALILHDCCKPDNTPKHNTRFDHPVLAAQLFKKVATNYITNDNIKYMKVVVPMVYSAIASHMGQFNTSTYARGVVLPKPKTGLDEFVHLCDYLGSRRFLEFNFDKYDYNSRG